MNPSQAIYTSDALPQTKRIMVKDEDVCLHCGLCAERCPTAAWDMRQFDLLTPYAGLGARPSALGGTPNAVPSAEHRVPSIR
jgi:ferredoxin